jgi:5-formyltetrahydrofolate cyclo-ligase
MAHGDDQVKEDDESRAFRAALRRERIAAREALGADEQAEKSKDIRAHLQQFLRSHGPATVAFYWPIRAEVDCRPLIDDLLLAGWRACLPVIVAPATAMIFRSWTPDTPMASGHHDIPTPETGNEVVPNVVLLPVNAFDAKGYRLGYGGGYFDRTLAALATAGKTLPLVVGVTFSLAGVETIRPHAQDIQMNAVVTEYGVIVVT